MMQVADAVLRTVGSRWTVPWTAETILKVSLFYFIFDCNIFPIFNCLLSFMDVKLVFQ